jgi:sugar O-acyltransferase (sialic acid O-acetyltransferase NeuD family)
MNVEANPTRALVWGASGHAAVVADAARRSLAWDVVGFIDEVKPHRRGESFAGSVVRGGGDALNDDALAGVRHVLLGVGDNRARLRIAGEVEQRGWLLGSVVHPRACIGDDVELAPGVFVGAGAVVNAGSVLGRACIINTNAVVEHHCLLEEGVHVAPGALLAGNVKVGRLAWIGLGAVVIEKCEIGAESVLGAGAVVVRDVERGVVAYGVPAAARRPIA